MKNIFIFISCLITGLAFTSCDNSILEATNQSTVEVKKDSYASFLTSLDSLNNNYNIVQNEQRGINFKKWTGKAFSAIIDYSVGTVAFAATSPLGGTLIGTCASWLYDEYWEKVVCKHFRGTQQKSAPTLTAGPSIVFNESPDASFIDSIGYYHNLLLAELDSLNVSGIDENNNIDYEGLFVIVQNLLANHGHNCPEINSEIKYLCFSYADREIKSLNPNEFENWTIDYNVLNTTEYLPLNIKEEQIVLLNEVGNSLYNAVVSLSDSNIISYGKDLYGIIENSKLERNEKDELHVLNNIAINSTLHWSSE